LRCFSTCCYLLLAHHRPSLPPPLARTHARTHTPFGFDFPPIAWRQCSGLGGPHALRRRRSAPAPRTPRANHLGIGSSVAGSASVAASLALITLRSRPLLLRIWSGFGLSALPLRIAGWRASDLWPRTRHLPQPHRPIECFAYNFFDCRHRGSLAASTQVNHAPHVRQPPSIFSTYAPRLERVLLTRGD
jgi:hypothetical protein